VSWEEGGKDIDPELNGGSYEWNPAQTEGSGRSESKKKVQPKKEKDKGRRGDDVESNSGTKYNP